LHSSAREQSVLRSITDSDLGQASVTESSGTPACKQGSRK
jgi:hypothetical protein